MRKHQSSLARGLLVGQGAYFLATGLWPIVERTSFERVTGSTKTDFRLVRAVGAVTAAIGAAMLVAALRRRLDRETRLLAATSAGALAAIAASQGVIGRTSKGYLVGAAIESALAAGWLAANGMGTGRPKERLEILTGEQQPD